MRKHIASHKKIIIHEKRSSININRSLEEVGFRPHEFMDDSELRGLSLQGPDVVEIARVLEFISGA